MKVSIPKRDLLATLKYAKQTVERRNTIPILGNVLLNAKSNKLSVKATDLDLEVDTAISCEVTRAGGTTVPAHMLESIVSKCRDDAEIILEQAADEPTCTVKSGRSRFKLQVLPCSDFPDLGMKDTVDKFELPVAEFANLVNRSSFCISSEETRYYLNGIFFHHIGDGASVKLRGVATDGHKLAQIECDAPSGSHTFKSDNNPTGVIIPRKTVKLLSTIIKDGVVEKIGIELNAAKARFTMGQGVTIASKLIDGSFPDYQRVVPTGNTKIVRADRTELKEAIDRLATIATERGKAVKFALTGKKLVLSINNADTGSGTDELDVDYNGDPLEIGFNSVYMMEILDNVDRDRVELRFADPGSPAIIVGVDKPEFLFVAMPMRV